jgi:hypothetical protein
VFLFGAPIGWISQNQSVTAAEFIAANDGLLQAEWIKLVVDEILESGTLNINLTVLITPLTQQSPQVSHAPIVVFLVGRL